MAELLTLVAQSRDLEKTPRALRREGSVPGVLYGNQFASVSLQFPEPVLRRLLNTVGTTRLFVLDVADQGLSETALVRAVQKHPVTGGLVHVDLYRIVADQAITTAVPLRMHGEAPAIEEGGVVNTLLDELEIECLPKDLPDHIVVDLTALTGMDSAIHVRDLAIPEGVTVLIDQDTVVARIVAPRGGAEEEAEEIEAEEEPESQE
ncbi:MAG: 50S ribosomal protein L25 [Anaerolineae bacterium]